MAAEAEAQAKQLDSVTDRVDEQEVDGTKAQEAMNALMTKNEANVSAADQVAVSKEDVAAIVDELEVTEELAERTLRQAALEMRDSDSVLFVALRKLVTST
jgi:hypothetical protein